MKKLSLDALQSRVSEVTTVELMSQISGGTDNDCHRGNGIGVYIGEDGLPHANSGSGGAE